MTTKQESIVTGIVLKSTPYKESDALLQVYTYEYGRITLLAKGIKKMKSKNAAGCQTLTLSEFTCIIKKGISTLIKATPISFYRHIKEDIVLEAYATYFCEFIYKFTEENEPDDFLYEQFKTAMDYLEHGYSYQRVYVIFNAMILKLTGTPLVVDECSYCGRQDGIVGISYTGGGFVCQNCAGEYDNILDKEMLKTFRHINKLNLLQIDKLEICKEYENLLVKIMETYIDEYTGIVFKSRKFIKQFREL